MNQQQIQRLSDAELLRLSDERKRRDPFDTSEYAMMLAREIRYRKRHGRCGGFSKPIPGPSLKLQLRQD